MTSVNKRPDSSRFKQDGSQTFRAWIDPIETRLRARARKSSKSFTLRHRPVTRWLVRTGHIGSRLALYASYVRIPAQMI